MLATVEEAPVKVESATSRVSALVMVCALVVGAFVLYRPALRIGLLSDDYALLMWARRLELMPRDWGQIRPLPILVWRLVSNITSVGQTPAALHALSIGLHGLNAALVWLLARRLTASAWTAAFAAALFVAMPIGVEPVAWASGIFDIMLATFALALGLTVTAQEDLTPARLAGGVLLAIAMMTSKETGVVAGLLVLLLYWTRWGRVSRGAWTLVGILLVLAGAYALTRELTGRLDHRLTPRLDVESAGRLVSGLSRAFIIPLHRDIIQAYPALAVASGAVITTALAAWIVSSRATRERRRLAVLTAAGTLVCVAPAIRLFGITPDLQGTRYVYLAGAWWSMALASAMLDGWTARRTRIAATAMAAIVAGGAVLATRAHLQPWTQANATRDRVLRELIALPPTCQQAAATGVPDNVSGAYVFRNGLNEALATLGRSFEWVSADRAAPECRIDIRP